MHSGFLELTIILCGAAVLSVIAKMLRQPIILAYIAIGLLIGYFGLFEVGDNHTFKLFGELGIMFLLFLVGLEINYSSLKLVGRVSLVLGLGQIIFTSVGGFFLARMFGFPALSAAYVAVALTFSSTIIIVKLLSDKRDLNSLYGKISVGFLLVQDLVAILMLVILTSIGGSQSLDAASILLPLGKAILLFGAVLWLGRKILPIIFERVAHSQEILFITSLAWVFALALFVRYLGFSIEIAGFLAGIGLANSSEHFQIANRIRPLRDFFMVVFFVALGSTFVFSDVSAMIKPILVMSLFVLVGNPLIVLILMGLMGYRKRTGFLTGLTVAQISEFSLILIALGLSLGHVDQKAVSVVTTVGIITITLSTYMIMHGSALYRLADRLLWVFERRRTHEIRMPQTRFNKPVVLVGFHRTGRSLAHNFDKDEILVVDFDPENAVYLEQHNFAHILGDISDPEVFEASNAAHSKIFISTSPDFEDNLIILNRLRKLKRRPKIVVRTETEHEAQAMYQRGADYVLIPHISSGQILGEALSQNRRDSVLKKMRQKDLKVLETTYL